MSVATYPSLLQLPDSRRLTVGWTLVLSLFLHCALFIVIGGLRLAPRIDRPLASYQVSLVSMPVPAPVAKTPAPVEPEPPPRAEEPPLQPVPTPSMPKLATLPPAPVAKVAPKVAPSSSRVRATAPRAAPVTAAPRPRETPNVKAEPDNLLRDVLKGIELPPNAPRLGDIAPPAPATPLRRVDTYRPDPTAQKLSKTIRDLQVPDVPAAMPTQESTATPIRPAQPVVSEDLLEKLQQPVARPQRSPERSAIAPRDSPMAAARPATSPTKQPIPSTAIQASGPEASPYWALVQQKISNTWVAPPVDLTQRFLQVIIRFMMDRSGKVSEVTVVQSSGNDYFDNAGKRAVLAANPLPPFPTEITERLLTPQVVFTVGERG
jgi:TonB family protein